MKKYLVILMTLSVGVIPYAYGQDFETQSELVRQGIANYRRGNFKDAVKDFNGALELNPTDEVAATIYNNRGWAYYELNKLSKAIEDFTTAIRLAERSKDYYSRGSTYYLQRDYEKAKKDLTKALELDPEDEQGKVFYMLGNISYRRDDYEEALRNFNEALKRAPENCMALNNRGTIYYETKQYDAAYNDWQKAMTLDPVTEVKKSLQENLQRVTKKIVSAGLRQDSTSTKGPMPVDKSAVVQRRYVVDNYYHKAMKAVPAEKKELLERAIEGFETVIEASQEPKEKIVRQVSLYDMAQCYRELGDKENYKETLGAVLMIFPDPVDYDKYPDTVEYMRALRMTAQAELEEVR